MTIMGKLKEEYKNEEKMNLKPLELKLVKIWMRELKNFIKIYLNISKRIQKSKNAKLVQIKI